MAILLWMCDTHINKKINLTTVHHWRDGHSTSIKCLWGVGGKGRGSSLQEGTSHTYTLRLG